MEGVGWGNADNLVLPEESTGEAFLMTLAGCLQ